MLYINCYNGPRFLAAISIKVQKENKFWQFKDHSSRKSHVNWTSDPIFFVYFFSSNCLWNYFLCMKIAKIHFHVVPLKFILVSKIPQFWTKTKYTLRILKIHIKFSSTNGAKKIFIYLSFDLSIEFLIIGWPVLHWKTLFTILWNELLFIRNQVLLKKWKLLGAPAQRGAIIFLNNFAKVFYRIFHCRESMDK